MVHVDSIREAAENMLLTRSSEHKLLFSEEQIFVLSRAIVEAIVAYDKASSD